MSMNAPPTHPANPGGAGRGIAGAEGFAKKHMLLLAGILAGIVVLFLFLRNRSSAGSGSGGLIQYPDNTASGLPTPGGAASGSPVSTGSTGAGNTTSPDDLFGSFLQGFALGQSNSSSEGPTDSSGESNPLDLSGLTNAITALGNRVNPAAPPAIPPAIQTTAGAKKKLPPSKKKEPVHPHPGASVHGNITTNTHPAVRTGQARSPRPAGTTAIGRQITSTLPKAQQLINGLAPNKAAHPAGKQTGTPIVALQQNKATGSHATGALFPTNKAPLTTAHTTIKKLSQQQNAPGKNTIPHVSPVSAHAVPRSTPVSRSAQISKPLLAAPLQATQPIQATVGMKNTLLAKFAPKRPPVQKTPVVSTKSKKNHPAAKRKR